MKPRRCTDTSRLFIIESDSEVSNMAGNAGNKPHKPKRRSLAGYLLVLAVVLLLCGVLSYKKTLLVKEQEKVMAKYDSVSREYDEEVERGDKLKELSIYTQTKKFIEDIAREKFGLVYDNEVIFTPEE